VRRLVVLATAHSNDGWDPAVLQAMRQLTADAVPTVAVGWMVFHLFALALVLFLRFHSGAWRRIVLVDAAGNA
jgi:hypothetical protein